MTATFDFEGLLKAAMGLDAAAIGPTAIERAVEQRLAACGMADPGAYWEHVQRSQAERQELIEAVVVPETWLFRDRESFAALSQIAQDELTRRPDAVLRLLSLPCSTGEEPYSIAMALLDAGIPADRFRVDGVDISTRALARAERAVYGRNSFRGQALAFRDRHFDATAEGYRLHDDVRAQVQFQGGNLFADDFLPGIEIYDAIFCRNVLIYFDRDTQDRAMGVLKRLLRPTGVLFVAPAETALPSSHDLVAVTIPLSFAFRRRDGRDASRAARATVLPPIRPTAAIPARRLPHPGAPHRTAPAATVRPTVDARTESSSSLADAMGLANEGHFVEAATCCAEHMRRHGPTAEALYLLGLVRDATGNPSEAAGYYRKALYLDPNHYEAQVHLALLVEKQGDAAGALVLRNRARRIAQRMKASHE